MAAALCRLTATTPSVSERLTELFGSDLQVGPETYRGGALVEEDSEGLFFLPVIFCFPPAGPLRFEREPPVSL